MCSINHCVLIIYVHPKIFMIGKYIYILKKIKTKILKLHIHLKLIPFINIGKEFLVLKEGLSILLIKL
jgi:hypothetical protein